MSHTSRVLSLAFAGALAAALASPAAALSNDPSEPSAARLDPIVQAQAPSVPDAPPAPSAGTPSASEPAAPATAEPAAAASARAAAKPRAARAPVAQAPRPRVVRAAPARVAPARSAYVVATRFERAPFPLFIGVGF